MASVIEQFRDLFVFAYGKKCDLGLAVPKFRVGEEKLTKYGKMVDIAIFSPLGGQKPRYKRILTNYCTVNIARHCEGFSPRQSTASTQYSTNRRCT